MRVMEEVLADVVGSVTEELAEMGKTHSSEVAYEGLVELLCNLPFSFIDRNLLSQLARRIEEGLGNAFPRLDIFTVGLRGSHGFDTIYVSVAV